MAIRQTSKLTLKEGGQIVEPPIGTTVPRLHDSQPPPVQWPNLPKIVTWGWPCVMWIGPALLRLPNIGKGDLRLPLTLALVKNRPTTTVVPPPLTGRATNVDRIVTDGMGIVRGDTPVRRLNW